MQGLNNTVVGYYAGAASKITNSVMIGRYAGEEATNSDSSATWLFLDAHASPGNVATNDAIVIDDEHASMMIGRPGGLLQLRGTYSIPAANVTGSIGVHRYLAFDDTGFEIMVTASALGITATTVGSTVTFTVPAGVVMLKAKIRIPSGITAPITLAGLPGTSDIDRTTVSVAVYYDAAGTTGAQITTAAGQEVVANVNQWKVLGHDATKAVVICAEFQ